MSRFIASQKVTALLFPKKRLQVLLLIACSWCLLGGLVACGFQLRGSQSLPFQSISIKSIQEGPVMVQLITQLKLKDITVIDGADIQLVLGHESLQKKAVLLSRSGTIREYELIHQVGVSIVYDEEHVIDKKQSPLSQSEMVRVVRRFDDDQTKLLAKKEEEELIRQEMVNDIVQQIFLRLQSLKVQ